jgi:hypothetical protein
MIGVGLLAVAVVTTPAMASGVCTVGENVLSDYAANPTTAPSGGLVNSSVFNCTIAPLTFSNFSYLLSSGAFSVTPLSVNIEVASLVGGQVIFEFDPNIAASSDLELEDLVGGGLQGVDLSSSIAGT